MRIAACLLLLPLAACAQKHPSMYRYWTPAPVAARTATGVAYVPDRINGSYQGTAYLTSAPNLHPPAYWKHPRVDDAVCPHTTYGVIYISDHVLTYAYAPNLAFAAPVASDGTITQTLGSATLSGAVRHARLTFNVVTPLCTTRFFGSYKLNHP